MALAKDVMTSSPFLLGSGTSLTEAVDEFNKNNFSSAPVITPVGEILGQLSEMDLVKAFVNYKSKGPNYSKVIHAQEFFEPVFFVKAEDHLTEVIRIMIKSPSHRVLVKDKKDKIVGIISPKDVLHKLHATEDSATSLFEELKHLYEENEKLKERMLEMKNYLNTYDSVFHSGLYMLHSADKEGKIILANEKLHAALGYQPGELMGKTIFDIYPVSVHAEAKVGLSRVMQEGRHSLTYSSMVKKDGSSIRVDLASAALRDEEGRFLGTFTISRQYGSEAMLRSLHGIFDETEEENKEENTKK